MNSEDLVQGREYKIKDRSGKYIFKALEERGDRTYVKLVGENGGTYTVNPEDLLPLYKKRDYKVGLPEDMKINTGGTPREATLLGESYKIW